MNKDKMMTHVSIKLGNREKIFPTLDLELGAVIVMLQSWKYYLYCSESVICSES